MTLKGKVIQKKLQHYFVKKKMIPLYMCCIWKCSHLENRGEVKITCNVSVIPQHASAENA